MRASSLLLLSLVSSSSSLRVARRVDQSINPRAEYVGGFAWATSEECTGDWSSKCETSNNSCCPTGETCFKTGYGAYCCPTSDDCSNKLLTLPACADQTMIMYAWPYAPHYFCCTPGLVGVKPYSGDGGLCMDPDQDVPTSLILQTGSQVGVGIVRTHAPSASASAASASATGAIISYGSSRTNAGITSGSARATSSPTSTPAPSSSSRESNPVLSTGAIIGIAVSAAVVIIVIASLCCWRQSKQKTLRQSEHYSPPTGPPMYESTPTQPQSMYVTTGLAYHNQGSQQRGALNKVVSPVAVMPVEPPQSPVPMSPLPSPRVMSPAPPYGATPSQEYRELHGVAALPAELQTYAVPRKPVDSTVGRQEM